MMEFQMTFIISMDSYWHWNWDSAFDCRWIIGSTNVNSMTTSFYSSLLVNVEFWNFHFVHQRFFFDRQSTALECGEIFIFLFEGCKHIKRKCDVKIWMGCSNLLYIAKNVLSLLFVTLMNAVISGFYQIMTLCLLTVSMGFLCCVCVAISANVELNLHN